MIPKLTLICLLGTLLGVTLAISDSKVTSKSYSSTEIPFEIAFRGVAFIEMEVSLPNKQVLRGSFLVDTAGGWMAVYVYDKLRNANVYRMV